MSGGGGGSGGSLVRSYITVPTIPDYSVNYRAFHIFHRAAMDVPKPRLNFNTDLDDHRDVLSISHHIKFQFPFWFGLDITHVF